jgi:hypothetical protein
MTTVTRTLYALPSSLPALRAACKAMAFVCADLWRRYGALQNVGKSAADIRKEITSHGWYSALPVDGTIRAETTKDAVNDILTYKAAASLKVRQAIGKRTSDTTERKRLYGLPVPGRLALVDKARAAGARPGDLPLSKKTTFPQ